MRTVKSCVGSTWCRYGVQDSTGARDPRRGALPRPARAAQAEVAPSPAASASAPRPRARTSASIATEKGWNLYVCGNGGAKPRHADLLAADLDEATLIRYHRPLPDVLHPHRRPADPHRALARGAAGRPRHLRKVVVDDHLGIARRARARRCRRWSTATQCEWPQVVEDPGAAPALPSLRGHARSPTTTLCFVEERGQRRPRRLARGRRVRRSATAAALPSGASWVPLASASEVPRDGGIAVRYGDVQLALFHVAGARRLVTPRRTAARTRAIACSARGIVGDQGGRPKLACPQHKKTFDLETGEGLSDPEYPHRQLPGEGSRRGRCTFCCRRRAVAGADALEDERDAV